MLKAKVVLRGARTYTLGAKRWIKDVPCIVLGEDIAQYKENGYFYVAMLESSGNSKKLKKEKAKESSRNKAKSKGRAKKKAKLKKNRK